MELSIPQPRRHALPLAPAPRLAVAPELPPLGSALPVVVLPGALPGALPQVGGWVKIKVVGVAAVQGQWQAVFGACSRLTQSQPAPGWEAFWQSRLDGDAPSEWPAEPGRLATACNLPELPRRTVRQVLQAAAGGAPGPFKLLARMAGYAPDDARAWCRAAPQRRAGGAAWEWGAQLLLEDATGAAARRPHSCLFCARVARRRP